MVDVYIPQYERCTLQNRDLMFQSTGSAQRLGKTEALVPEMSPDYACCWGAEHLDQLIEGVMHQVNIVIS
jgi:hypothetical protein